MDVAACLAALIDAAPAELRLASGSGPGAELAVELHGFLARSEIDAADATGFCAHLGARLDGSLEGLEARDLAVAYRCLRGQRSAIDELERDHLVAARTALRRMGAGAELDEQLQLLRARLLVGDAEHPARIADYRGHGGLRRWIRTTAVHQYLNDVRGRRREVGVDDATSLAGTGSDPRLVYLKERYRDSFARAIAAAAGRLDPLDRAALRYTFVDGLNLDGLGRALRVSRATAHRRLAAARAALLAGTERELQQQLALTREDVVSLHRLVRSQLELSLRRIFASEP